MFPNPWIVLELSDKKMDINKRIEFGNQPIEWVGDLEDDCWANWAGLLLRAEWMNGNSWWWSVYDMQRDELTIDCSNDHLDKVPTGGIARARAESAAKSYITTITKGAVASYVITDTFIITGRGLVLSGYIKDGFIVSGNTIEIVLASRIRHRKIIGVDDVRKPLAIQRITGLQIQCVDDYEIKELREWEPNHELALVFA